MNDKEVYRLKEPIEFTKGDFIEEVTIVPPKGKQLRKINFSSKEGGEMTAQLISACCHADGRAICSDIVDELSAVDFMVLAEKVSGFLETSQRTGKS